MTKRKIINARVTEAEHVRIKKNATGEKKSLSGYILNSIDEHESIKKTVFPDRTFKNVAEWLLYIKSEVIRTKK